jgi:uncharacterized protein Usg
MSDFQKQLQDYRLTTAEILYHLPDYPSLLQSFIWQELDIAPKFPVLMKFLKFWEKNLDGKLNKVVICSNQLIKPAEFKYADLSLSVH